MCRDCKGCWNCKHYWEDISVNDAECRRSEDMTETEFEHYFCDDHSEECTYYEAGEPLYVGCVPTIF